MFRNVSSVAVLVRDARKAAEWYREKLGFEVTIQGHWVAAKPPGSPTMIHLCERCKEWGDDAPGGNTGIYIQCEDKQGTFKDLKARGIEFAQELTTEPWGTYAIFKDLDGNEFWM